MEPSYMDACVAVKGNTTPDGHWGNKRRCSSRRVFMQRAATFSSGSDLLL